MASARPTTTIDNEQLRVTVWTFDAQGASTGRHLHEFDYLVVPVSGGLLHVTASDGAEHELTQIAGSPYLGAAGTDHEVASAGQAPITFVEVELKR